MKGLCPECEPFFDPGSQHEAMISALQHDHPDCLRCIGKDYIVNFNCNCIRPLAWALCNGRFKCARACLELGCKPVGEYGAKSNALHAAISSGSSQTLAVVLELVPGFVLRELMQMQGDLLFNYMRPIQLAERDRRWVMMHQLLDAGDTLETFRTDEARDLVRGRRWCKAAAKALYEVVRKRVRVYTDGFPRGYAVPVDLAKGMAAQVWATRTDTALWISARYNVKK